jgi:transposase
VAARISGHPEIRQLVHEVRLIPPAYVKRFAKRQKNDAAGVEAMRGFEPVAQRSTDPGDRWKATHQRRIMRFVPVKSEETQGKAIVFRVRELLIRQRTQAINALRGHLTEFGEVLPQEAWNARPVDRRCCATRA